MEVGIRRWLVMRCLTTTSASRKAWAVSPPSWWKVKATLSGHSGWTAGAPGARAFSGSATAASGLVIDLDEVGGVGRDVAIGGDDDGHGMADEVDAVLGQQVVVRHAEAGEGRGAGHGAEGLDIVAGEDGDDAGVVEGGLLCRWHLILAAACGLRTTQA